MVQWVSINLFLWIQTLSDAKKRKLGNKYGPINLFIETYNYDVWFENEESTDTTSRKSDKHKSADLSDMPPLEGAEEIKEGKGLKILSPNKLLTRLPILLVQIKAWNNSHKLKKWSQTNTVSFIPA